MIPISLLSQFSALPRNFLFLTRNPVAQVVENGTLSFLGTEEGSEKPESFRQARYCRSGILPPAAASHKASKALTQHIKRSPSSTFPEQVHALIPRGMLPGCGVAASTFLLLPLLPQGGRWKLHYASVPAWLRAGTAGCTGHAPALRCRSAQLHPLYQSSKNTVSFRFLS